MLHFDDAIFCSAGKLIRGSIEVDGVNVSLKESFPLPVLIADIENLPLIVPGFVDVHVHLREPGFFYKESISTGTLAAASAGYTALFAMPNLNPVPDSAEHIAEEQRIIDQTARVHVLPYAAITVGQRGAKLVDMEELAPLCVAFSDDGKGVQSEELMREAMLRAKKQGKIIVAHCEDEKYLQKGGCVHDGDFAKAHGLVGISSESEWKEVERDIALVRETGCRFHVCHVSTKESVELIRKAKREGLPVTAETAPHYLTLCEEDLKDEGRWKMNPPLRSSADRDALVEALRDGTIDCVATDHAPHSEEEKSRGLAGSLFGIVGLETAFPVLYTELVRTGKLSLERLIDAMSCAPRRIFGLEEGADFAVYDLSAVWTVKGKEFNSKGSATPYEGRTLFGRNTETILNGDIIWKRQREN